MDFTTIQYLFYLLLKLHF